MYESLSFLLGCCLGVMNLYTNFLIHPLSVDYPQPQHSRSYGGGRQLKRAEPQHPTQQAEKVLH